MNIFQKDLAFYTISILRFTTVYESDSIPYGVFRNCPSSNILLDENLNIDECHMACDQTTYCCMYVFIQISENFSICQRLKFCNYDFETININFIYQVARYKNTIRNNIKFKFL